uniref:Anthranilate synthase component I-2, chloroplastic n=1 Tax=Anthurium amnicola TaxID=1678845 RepID=A0A1D1ZK83_9ARAE
MMKASCNFLSRLSRHAVIGRVLFQQVSNVKEASKLSRFTFQNDFSTSKHNFVANETFISRTYADFAIFKGKAALSVFPVMPKFSKMDSGCFIIDKKGVVMLKFMPAIGVRKYDPQRKQVFALSPTEVGCLISLGPQDSCEFFHDPSMKSSLEGQVKKTLTVNPTSNDGGYFITLNVTNVSEKISERFSLPLSKAEFAVLRASFSFILPHIMGWDRLTAPQPAIVGSNPPKLSAMQLSPELEWDK